VPHAAVGTSPNHYAQNDTTRFRSPARRGANLNRTTERDARPARAAEPLYPAEELHGVIPADTRQALRRARGDRAHRRRSEFDEFKADYGATRGGPGFLRVIWGYPIGVVREPTGSCFPNRRWKGTHFIELRQPARHPASLPANHRRLHGGEKNTRRAASPRTRADGDAVACSRVPKFTVIIGGFLRRGQLRHVRPRFRPALPLDVPNARISVMGGQQAALRSRHGGTRRDRGQGRHLGKTERKSSSAHPRPIRAPGASLLRHRALGTTV